MPRRIKIQPHLSLDELEARYRQAKDGTERSHYQIIWLLSQGKPTEEVSDLTGYSRSWIYELVWGYNRIGPDSLGDKRHRNPGNKALLDDEQRAALWEALRHAPPEGGKWNGPKVAAWMSQQLGRPIAPQRGWEYLRSLQALRRKPPGKPNAQESGPGTLKRKWRRSKTQSPSSTSVDSV